MRDLDAIMAASGFGGDDREKEKPICETLTKDEKLAAKMLIKNMTI
jgi:Ku70/Ku80 C-terminal arm